MDGGDADCSNIGGTGKDRDLPKRGRTTIENYMDLKKKDQMETQLKCSQLQETVSEVKQSLEAQERDETNLLMQHINHKKLYLKEKEYHNEFISKICEIENLMNVTHEKIKIEKSEIFSEDATLARAETIFQHLKVLKSKIHTSISEEEANNANTIARLQSELDQYREKNKTALSNYDALKAERSAMTDKFYAEVRMAEQTLQRYKSERETLNGNLIELQNDIIEKEQKLGKMLTDMEKRKQFCSDDIGEDASKIEQLKDIIKEQRKEWKALKEELSVEEKATEELRRDIQQLEEEELRLENDLANDDTPAIEENLKILSKDYEKICNEVESLKNKLEDTKKVMSERTKKLKVTENKVNTLRERMNDQHRSKEEMHKSKEDLKRTLLEEIRREEEEARDSAAALCKAIEAEREVLREKTLLEEGRNEKRRVKVAEIKETITVTEANLKAMLAKVKELKGKIKVSRLNYNEIKKKNAEISSELEAVTGEKETASKKLRMLEEKNRQYDKDINRFHEERNKIIEEIANIKETLAKKVADERAQAERRDQEKAELEKSYAEKKKGSEESHRVSAELENTKKELENLKMELSTRNPDYEKQLTAARERMKENDAKINSMMKELKKRMRDRADIDTINTELWQRLQSLTKHKHVRANKAQEKEEIQTSCQFKKPLTKNTRPAPSPGYLKPVPGGPKLVVGGVSPEVVSQLVESQKVTIHPHHRVKPQK